MATLAEIQALIDAFPTGQTDGVSAQMIIDVLQALKNREMFSKEWSDLLNVPQTLYTTDRHLANVEQVSNPFTLHASKSGWVFVIDSSSTLNIQISTGSLPEGFECTMIQKREGSINTIDVDGVASGTPTFYTPDGYLSETEHKMDILYLIVVGGLLLFKGDLKHE